MEDTNKEIQVTARGNGVDGSTGNYGKEVGSNSEVVPTKPGRVRVSSPDRYRAKTDSEITGEEYQCLFGGDGEDVDFYGYSGDTEVCGLKECKVEVVDENYVRKYGGQVVKGIRCKSCWVAFASQLRLDVHLRNHPECSDYAIKCAACGRAYKNEAGLRSHLGQTPECKTFSNEQDQDLDHGLPSGSNSEQLTGLDTNHIAKSRYDLDAEKSWLGTVEQKDPIKWPKMSDNKAWMQFDQDVCKQLNWSGGVEQRLKLLETVIYEEGKNYFGVREQVSSKRTGPPRCERRITKIRKEIKNLTKLAGEAGDSLTAGGYLVVRDDLREKIRHLKKKEGSRKRRWRRTKARGRFIKDPYKASKDLLSPKDKTPLAVEKQVIDDYIKDVASDGSREVELGVLDGLPDVEVSKRFDGSKFRMKQLESILRKTRNASAPGPNKIPYKVYKKCSKIVSFLFGIMRLVETSKVPPLRWRISDGVFIPKVMKPDAGSIGDYRQIALLNVEGKLFWSMTSNRLYNYLVEDNKFIKTAVQKGSIRGMAGCWEHTSLMWATMRDAKLKHRSLAALWLDLANAYGSVPHKLIEYALVRYQVPEEWRNLLLGYYDGLWGRTSSGKTASEWFRYEKGIFAGCTVSVVLFLMAFNVILEYVEAESFERYSIDGKPVELLRGFMDDVSIVTTSIPQTKKVLQRTDRALKWARMRLKPAKSRSLVIIDGRSTRLEPFSVDGSVIPGLHNKPLRTLGRVFNFSLTDREEVNAIQEKFVGGLKKIDKSPFTGFMKAWALVHILIPQVQWDIMIYSISLKIVEELERKQSVLIRKWLGLAKHLTNVALFSKDVPITLPVRSLVEVFKTTKVRSFLQLKYSSDASVAAHAKAQVGKKWDSQTAINEAESDLVIERMVGDARSGGTEVPVRAGVGFVSQELSSEPVGSVGHRKSVVGKVSERQNEELEVKAVRQSMQGAWMTWSNYIRRNVTWKYAFTADSKLLKFCVGVTYNTKGTPSNLKLWGLSVDAKCKLCHQEICGIRHIISSCPFSLVQGRFDYRHNCVLRKLAHGIQMFLQNNKVVSQGIKRVHFVKASGNLSGKRRRKPCIGLLHQSSDFEMCVDLKKQLKFPEHIAISERRPDIVIHSNKLKKVILVELTSGCEELSNDAHLRKISKYGQGSDLWDRCVKNGWSVELFAVEVGARGYAAKSLPACLSKLGLSQLASRRVVKEAADEALRCTFWIWLARNNKEWSLGKGFSM